LVDDDERETWEIFSPQGVRWCSFFPWIDRVLEAFHFDTRTAKCTFGPRRKTHPGVGWAPREAGFGLLFTPKLQLPNEALLRIFPKQISSFKIGAHITSDGSNSFFYLRGSFNLFSSAWEACTAATWR
jgi:hypothetical protein